MAVKYLQTKKTTLAYGINDSATSMRLVNLVKLDGSSVAAADIGDLLYGTFDPGTSREEIFSIDGANVTVNDDGTIDITSVVRGLKEVSPYGAGGFATDHPAGSVVVFGDNPQLFQWLKDYIDGIAIAGAPDASTTAKGLVEEATQAEVDAGTAAGSTAARLFINPSTHRGRAYNDYAVDAVGTDAYAITPTPAITAYVAGQVFTFKVGTANTGPATLNVSGLGAKTIKKNVLMDLQTGDFLVNQIVMVQYDGTNFQLLSRASSMPIVRTYLNAGSPATWTKPDGLKYIVVEVQAAGGAGGGATTADRNGAGGGGGGYSKKTILAATLGATETVTTGAGGVAGTGDGGQGGSSSFGAHATATGGGGGQNASATDGIGGTGGIGSSGDINIQGGGGGGGSRSASIIQSGSGGSSVLGGGGAGQAGVTEAAGIIGGVYGGGGGGGVKITNSQNGGTGAAGIVIVTEFY